MRSVIWDMGGTLVDTYPDVDRALAAAAGTTPAEVAPLTRVSSSHAVTTLAARHGTPESALRAAYEGVKDHWREHPAPLRHGVAAVMETVRAGGGLNLVATHRDRASATQLLEALGVEVDDLVCAPDGFPRKPDPTMIRILLDRHALEPAGCLAVGDRPADVAAAQAAGVEGILLVTPGVPLEAPGAPRIDDLRELLPMLRATRES